jgi:predicted transcriptional regulator
MRSFRSSGHGRPGRITDALLRDMACSLTDRDRQILRLIRWHRVLTKRQVAMMFFSDRNTAQHRLTRLYDLRLVERFRPFHAGREGKYHYVLDRLGAYIVAAMASTDLDAEVTIRWRTDQTLSIATSQRLAHTVGTNDVFARLVAAGRTLPDAKLATWWGECYCKSVLGEVVRPDGLGVWREGVPVSPSASSTTGGASSPGASRKRPQTTRASSWPGGPVLAARRRARPAPRAWRQGRAVRRRARGGNDHRAGRTHAGRGRLGAPRRRRSALFAHRPRELAAPRRVVGPARERHPYRQTGEWREAAG